MDHIVFNLGIWAIIVYRLRRWAITECKCAVIRKICVAIGALCQLWIEIACGIQIIPGANIGPGLYVGHFGGIFIADQTRIGKFCNISQDTTIGVAGRGERRGVPEIGDFVYIAPGAKIIGKIRIGDHVAIGANAVVTKDVPNNAVVVGVPARVISYRGSWDFVEYNEKKNSEFLDK